jgi:hypothetical protein
VAPVVLQATARGESQNKMNSEAIFLNVTISDPLKQQDSFGSYMMYVHRLAAHSLPPPHSAVLLLDTKLTPQQIILNYHFLNFLF